MTSPKIKLVQIASIPLLIVYFNKKTVAIILIKSSKHCEIALLYDLPTLLKYPPITLEILINGSPREIAYIGAVETLSFNQLLEMIGANRKSSKVLERPSIREKNIHVPTALKPFVKSFFSNCSDTIHVHARLIPEVANVMAKLYTDITKLKIPIAS